MFAPAGGVNVKASAAGLMPVFQLLTRSVYCGALFTVLLVITILRGIGLLADLHPELPVGIGVAEGEMLAFHAVDDAAADMLGFQDAGHEDVVGVRQQQVGARQRDAMPCPQGLDQLVHACPGASNCA